MIRTRAIALLPVSLVLLASSLAGAAPPPVDQGEPPDPEAPVEGPLAPPEFEDPLLLVLQPRPGGLTSDEVARRAVESSPTIAAKQAAIELAEAQLDSTLYQFIPRVEVSFTYTRLSRAKLNFGGLGDGFLVGAANEGPLSLGPCAPNSIFQCVIDTGGSPVAAVPLDFSVPNPPLNSFSLQAQLGVPISDYIARLPGAKKSGEAQIEAAKLAREAEQLTNQKDARIAYYDWVRASVGVVALEQSIARTQARLGDAQASFDAGVASKADVMRLDAAVANLSAAKIEAENFRELAAQNLALLMGETDFPKYAIGEDVLAPEPNLADSDDLQTLIDEAQAERLESKAISASRRSIDQGIKVTRAGYYPRLDGFADATYANPNQRFFPLEPVWHGSWALGLRLSFVLGDAIRTSSKVDELEATRRQLDGQQALVNRGLALEVAAAWAERQSAAAALEFTEQAKQSAAEGYRVAVDLFQVGEATTTDILDAEYEQVATTLNAINTKIDLRIANLKLEYATGRLEPMVTEAKPGSMPSRE
ncbi:TolC family protein [Nannocystaceae bacterium ST9]